MHGVKGGAAHICDLQKLGANINAAAVQDLFGDAASDAQRCCEPTGKMTAAAHVGEAFVMDIGGVVGVGWARMIEQIAVIFRALVGVENVGQKREASGHAVHHASCQMHGVGFLALGREFARARRATRHETRQLRFVDGFAWRHAVDLHADHFAVAFAENAAAIMAANTRCHRRHLPGMNNLGKNADTICARPLRQ